METLKTNERYTYADYESWDEQIPRCELIDGLVYNMAGPSLAHQAIAGEIFFQLKNFLRGKTCCPIIAPFDVRLNHNTKDDTVVQPDVFVVCDRTKLENGKSCLGAPDFIIEVTSPSNHRHDLIVKLTKYLHSGVREFWVVEPEEKIVIAHRLVDSHYMTTIYSADTEIPVSVLEGCKIRMSEVFSE